MCCHFLLLGNLLDPGIHPTSPALQADSLPSEPPRKPRREKLIKCIKNFKTWFEQKWIQIRQHLIQQTARSSKELHKRRPYFYFVMSSLFKIVILCDYFSLRWVFIAMHKVFSSGSPQGLLCRCGVRPSHCSGFSCCRAQVVGCLGLSSCCFQVPENRLGSCRAQA